MAVILSATNLMALAMAGRATAFKPDRAKVAGFNGTSIAHQRGRMFHLLHQPNRFPGVRIRASTETAAPPADKIAPAIVLTEAAVSHLNRLKGDKKVLYLRVGVRQGGCYGMSYVMGFEDESKVRVDDSKIEADGIILSELLWSFVSPSLTSLHEPLETYLSFHHIISSAGVSYPVFLQQLSQVRRFVDDLLVPYIPSFSEMMYLDPNATGDGIYPKPSCELNSTLKGDSCHFLDLEITQPLTGLEIKIFDKRTQPEYADMDIIRMPHILSNISVTAKYRIMNS